MNNESIAASIIDADVLKNTGVQNRLINTTVLDILRNINEQITTSHREGQHYIIADIPIIFDIQNMSNEHAQLAVWSSIIDVLKAKNYRVWIKYSNNKCDLKISWLSKEDVLNLKCRQQIIKDHTVPNFDGK